MPPGPIETSWSFYPDSTAVTASASIPLISLVGQEIDCHPEVIFAGLQINKGMGACITDRLAHLMLKRDLPVVDKRRSP